MYGVEWDDPECLHTVDEAIEYINKIGFLPLFRQRRNKKGESYGWPIAVYTTPESLWGSAYKEKPEESLHRIEEHIKDVYPIATNKQIKKIIK